MSRPKNAVPSDLSARVSPNSIYRHLNPFGKKSSDRGSSSNSKQDQKDADDFCKTAAKNTRSNWLKQSPGLGSAGGKKPSHAIIAEKF